MRRWLRVLVYLGALFVAGDTVRTRVIAMRAVAAAPDTPMPWHMGDLYVLWAHVQRIQAGQPLYWPWPDFSPTVLRPGVAYPQGREPYPPFLTPALAPLGAHGLVQLALVWYALLAAALVVYAATLARLAGHPRQTVLALAVLLICPGTYAALYGGNAEPILWAATALALAYPLARGPGFAVVALVKLWGVWPLAFVWRRGGWRMLAGAAATVAVAVATSAAVLGPARFVASCADWFRYMLPVVGQGFATSHNFSPSWAVLRLFYDGGALSALARIWLTACAVGGPLLAGVLLRRRSVRVQLAGIVAAAVLCAPVVWLYYLPALLAPAAVWLGERSARNVEAEPAQEVVLARV